MQYKKKYLKRKHTFGSLMNIFWISPVLAQQKALENVTDVAGAIGLSGIEQDETLPAMIGNLINQLLGLVGVILVVLVIYAGFLWMTAGGSEEKVTKAKKWITNASIGLVLILSAYLISEFILKTVLTATG